MSAGGIKECAQCGKPFTTPYKKLCDTCRETPNPRCKKCKQVKPLSRFSRDASRPSGYFPWCMDCQNEGSKRGAWQNPDDELNGHVCPLCDTPIRGRHNRRFCSNTCKGRVAALKSQYGITPEQYRQMVDDCAGRCPICLKRPTLWNVDHAHKTKQVMGAVCTACNVGALAFTFHDVEFVRRLLDFLENPPALRLGIDVQAPELKRPGTDANIHKVWRHKQQHYHNDI